jgi:hypothetical protein
MMTRADIHVTAYSGGLPVAPPTSHNPYFRGSMQNPIQAPTFNLRGVCGDGVHAIDENGMPMACDPSDPSTQVQKVVFL